MQLSSLQRFKWYFKSTKAFTDASNVTQSRPEKKLNEANSTDSLVVLRGPGRTVSHATRITRRLARRLLPSGFAVTFKAKELCNQKVMPLFHNARWVHTFFLLADGYFVAASAMLGGIKRLP